MFILFTYVLNMTRFDVSIKKPVGLWESSPRLARSGYRGIDVYYTQMNPVGVPDYTLIHLDEALLTSAIKSDGDTVGFMLTSKCT